MRVEMRATVDAVNLDPHVQVFVEDNARVAHLISGSNQTVFGTNARDGRLFLLR